MGEELSLITALTALNVRVEWNNVLWCKTSYNKIPKPDLTQFPEAVLY